VRTVLPLAIPGLAASAIFVIIISWNEVCRIDGDAAAPTFRHTSSGCSASPRCPGIHGGFFLLVPPIVMFAIRRFLFGMWGQVIKGERLMAECGSDGSATFGKVTAVRMSTSPLARASSSSCSGRPAAQDDVAALSRRARARGRRQDLHRRRDATDLPPRKRRISMVFQSYAVFPHMKVREHRLRPEASKGRTP
jgi:hypothetical protein